MQVFRVHAFTGAPGIKVWGGSNYYVRTRWAISQALLQEPPGDVRSPINYFETAPIWVAVEPTPATPVIMRFDALLWEVHADIERNLFAVLEWRASSNDAWQQFEDFVFIINHEPTANAGPDQVVILDAQGRTEDDVRLDASGSDDPDLHAAINPDPGPLEFRWWPVETPLAIAANGTVWDAAYGLPEEAQPRFLPISTAIAFSDRGAYTFRVWVYDTDVANLGLRAGTAGVQSTTTRVLLGVGGPNLTIESPKTETPYFGNAQDGIDVRIYYGIGDAIANDPAYDGAWVIKCQIIQAIESTFLLSETVGTVVFESTKVSYQRVNYIQWNGLKTLGLLPGGPAIGAFDVRLELLDRNWNSTGVAGSVVTVQRAIVIDLVRWLLPVDIGFVQAVESGAFMESGHAGTMGTRLHTGSDIISAAGGQPDVVAARSGFYSLLGGGTNEIKLTHAPPDVTRYLHGDTLQAFAANALVIQGQRLARMSNAGTPGVHLHFEYHTEPPLRAHNPRKIIPLRDEFAPDIDAVFLRDPPADLFAPADLNNSSTGIRTWADLIVRCRDRAHPALNTPLDNGPYLIRAVDVIGVGNLPTIRFDAMSAINNLSEFFSLQGAFGSALIAANHYLPYLRWDTSPYGQLVSPLELRVEVADFAGNISRHTIVVGATCMLSVAPPTPATSSAAPASFNITVQVTNYTSGLDGIANDNYHIAFANAPAGWTVAPSRTGAIANGTSQNVLLTIDPQGNAAVGDENFDLVIYSGILEEVGFRLPLNITVVA
jgi:murein DD-endopeptidase MepM/ murein hydrolase activator NlpD